MVYLADKKSFRVVAAIGLVWALGACSALQEHWTQSGSTVEMPERVSNSVVSEVRSWSAGRGQRLAQGVTLQWAQQEALFQHPELLGSEWGLAALKTEAQAAGLRSNPSLSVEFEDFAGSGGFSGIGGSQTTVTYSQTIEAASKRAARKRLAELHSSIAQSQHALLGVRIDARTRMAFLGALAAQDELQLGLETEQELQGFHNTIAGRVQAGKASAVDLKQFDLLLNNARLQRHGLENEQRGSRITLAQCWGGEVDFDSVVGPWPASVKPPGWDELQQRWQASGGGQQILEQLRVGEAQAHVAEQERNRDWTFSAGLRRFEDSDDWAGVVGVELPLRVFDSGRSALEAARSRRKQGMYAVELAMRESKRELNGLHGRLNRSFEVVSRLNGEALQQAEWVASSTYEGYKHGRFDLLQAMEAQQSYFDLRTRLGAALLDHHLAWAELQYLLGETW